MSDPSSVDQPQHTEQEQRSQACKCSGGKRVVRLVLYGMVLLLAAGVFTASAFPEAVSQAARQVPQGWIPENLRGMVFIQCPS